MRTIIILAALAAVLATPAAAQTYVELRGGAVWLNDMETFDPGGFGTPSGDFELTTSPGWLAAVAVGKPFGGSYRAEIEYAHRELDADRLTGSAVNPAPPPALLAVDSPVAGSVAVDSLLVNAYADLAAPGAVLVPFIGAGAGVALVDTTINGVSDSDTMAALRLAAGLAYKVTPSLDVTLAADLFFADDGLPVGATTVQSYSTTAGLRFSF